MAVPSMARTINRPVKPVSLIFVRSLSPAAKRGYLRFGQWSVPCALGRSGIKVLKREGDGATPRGRFSLRAAFYRPDTGRPRTALSLRSIRADDGWCDQPSDRNYNRRVRLPYPANAERLWRPDRLYNVVVVLGYNDVPRIRGRGSAVFMHVARGVFEPTEGCVALRERDLRRLLSMLGRRSEIDIRL